MGIMHDEKSKQKGFSKISKQIATKNLNKQNCNYRTIEI